MILRLSRTQGKRGKLVFAREKLAGTRWGDSRPDNCKTSIRTGGSRIVIYRGDSESEQNQVKVEVPVGQEAHGREH